MTVKPIKTTLDKHRDCILKSDQLDSQHHECVVKVRLAAHPIFTEGATPFNAIFFFFFQFKLFKLLYNQTDFYAENFYANYSVLYENYLCDLVVRKWHASINLLNAALNMCVLFSPFLPNRFPSEAKNNCYFVWEFFELIWNAYDFHFYCNSKEKKEIWNTRE